MIYSDTFKLIYYPIFKTGSRSLRELLEILFQDMKYYQDTHSRRTPPSMKDYNKISMVRNPYDRAVSMWSHFKQMAEPTHPYPETKKMEFEEFMEWLVKHPKVHSDIQLMNQYDYLTGIDHLDAVYHLEDLSHRLPITNVGKHIAKHNNNTLKLVKQWAEPDFSLYGYK